MQRLRNLSRLIRALGVLFLVAQLAGVVPFPVGHSAAEAAVVSHVVRHVSSDTGRAALHCSGHHCGDAADHCCALHAYFAGFPPPPVSLEAVEFLGQRFASRLTDISPGVVPGRLDRPPRPLV